jgi:hypothetical protein
VTTTLRDLRRYVGDKTGDVLVLEATHASSTTDTFRDVVRLSSRGDRAPSVTTRILYISDGTSANIGHEAAVSDFASTSKTLTFTPVAPSAPQVGDEAELWSVTERIGSISALHRMINYAIAQVAGIGGVETADTPQTFDARTRTLTIPASWSGGVFGGARYTDRLGVVYEIPPNQLRVRGRTLEILGHAANYAHRLSVTLYGYPPLSALSTDTDTTTADPAWIVESVSGALTLARSWQSNDPAAAERRANYWSAQSALYRRNVATSRRGLNIAVP